MLKRGRHQILAPALLLSLCVAGCSAGKAGSTAATTGGGSSCTLVTNDQVEAAMQLAVQSVDVSGDGNKCTFHFKGGDHGDLEVTYAGEGGRKQLEIIRKASGIFGGVEKTVAAPASVTGVASETPPPDVAKVGDDQAFMTEGPVTQFYAAKGDAYVEVDGGFLPEGVSRWVLLPTIASRVLAARSTNP